MTLMKADTHARNATRSATRPQKRKIRGAVTVDKERCKGCGFCVEFCPLGVLALSARFNAKGYHYPEVVAAEKCSGCDLCGMYCPDFAISGVRVTEPDESTTGNAADAGREE
jgi:2-oxoglutarate ferredoxin oxidoreductase subunit delta